jgi:5'-nucleotidase
MAFPIDKKFVIAVSSSALFDMKESDEVFKEKGVEAYRKYQTEKIDDCLEKGVAFPFIRRFLGLNAVFPDLNPVEVAKQGQRVSIPVKGNVRPSDKLYKLITVNEIKEIK